MFEGLSFGWRTAVLAVAMAQLLILAVALARQWRNRVANRTLALLLLILVGILTPWMIGFAGAYDKWRGLTFAPFQIALAVGPLFFFYVHALATGRWPPKASRHFIAPGLQFGFYAASFALPMPLKSAWADALGNIPGLVFGAALILSLVYYARASLTLLSDYREALLANRSDDHRYAALWVQAALGGLFVMLAVWTGFLIWDAIWPLGYTGLMWLYLAIAAFALFLGAEGWRHARIDFPILSSLRIDTDEAVTATGRDWTAIGSGWADRVRSEGWDADPDLSLATLARRLGTNTAYLSRALNEGLGLNFSAFVNGLRSERVAAQIDAGRSDDLLDLALEAGFSSKASFNRAFRDRMGMTPSAWRARLKP